MKKLYTIILAAVAAVLVMAQTALAAGWPANYEGVMLQGFYWDSYKGADKSAGTVNWSVLTGQADELSKYFKLIWVPNSAQANGENYGGNGYMPIYWFTNHRCAYGTEAQLKTMIATYKAKGVGIIEDVVVNHRVGSSNWYNFPSESWNGKTYQLTNGAICSTDEMWKSGGQGCPYTRGNPDTGDDFDGARDLDHTNPTVQDHVKNYCKFLIDEMGYAGFRLDMVKGYGGQYTKIYNQYARPQFSVGEYFDGSYDAVAAWIEATGRESAAFDFPFKYAVNEAFASGDMRKLSWKANGTVDQPAGLIHFGYPQYAVTFIDNHDTYRDGSKFTGNVLAANAFMLCSPGTPCVFWTHYVQNKAAIQALINVRNEVGVHNMSPVRVLRLEANCYMAEVTGTKGKLVVKIGSAMVSPDGYTDAQIKASGNGYCVWATASGGVTPDPTPSGQPFKVYFDNSKSRWAKPHIHYWGSSESEWPGVAMSAHKDNVWVYTVPAGTTGLLFNAGDGDPTKTADFTAYADHIYDTTGDKGVYNGGSTPAGNYPSVLYLMGNVNGGNWSPNHGVAARGADGVYEWPRVTVGDAGGGAGYFSFSTALASSADTSQWDAVVNASDRFGASSSDLPVATGQTASIVLYAANAGAAGAASWKIVPGDYSITADLSQMTLTVGAPSTGIDEIEAADLPAVYFNLQGVRVDNPGPGLYIRVQGNKASKVIL